MMAGIRTRVPGASDLRSTGRDDSESEAQRLQRNVAELLQELRVAEVGVQILFAFLLTLPFSQRFTHLNGLERRIYFATLLLAAGSSALFIAPTAFHRIVFRQKERPLLVEGSSWMLLGGLTLLLMSICGAILLVTDFMFGLGAATGAVVGVAAFYGLFWYGVPVMSRILVRRRSASSPRDSRWPPCLM